MVKVPASDVKNATLQETTAEDCAPVFDKIEQWKKQLLDLTRRNNLLYLTEAKVERLVGITSPSLQLLLNAEVKRGRSLNFPMPISNQLTLANIFLGQNSEQEPVIRKGDLETNVPITDLQRRLYRLRREWKTWLEEQGIHTLFLATGFLKWRETSLPDDYLAPIILVPLGLERESLDKPYSLKPVEEDIVVNPALTFKLKTDFGIDLPELGPDLDGELCEKYLISVEEVVKKLGWQVLREAKLGRFTYEKFVMYSDLTSLRDLACHHPIIRTLAKAPVTLNQESLEIPGNIDDVVNPAELFPILDSDSSQTEVLLRARHGENLVVHGPPGTGKSQTISNLIAQGLREGKKILFVSEKMAALEVVYRRLQEANLSFACLEVHSHKSDKAKVVQELAKTARLASDTRLESDATEEYKKLIRLRDQLNGYVIELHKPRGNLKLSAFQVHGKLSRILNAPRIEFKLPFARATETVHENLDRVFETISQLQQVGNVFDDAVHHPWYGTEVKSENYSDLLVLDQVSSYVDSLRKSLSELQSTLPDIASKIGADRPTSLRETRVFTELLQLLSERREIVGNWLRLTVEDLIGLVHESKVWKERFFALKERRGTLQKSFDLKVLALPIDEMLKRFSLDYKTHFRFLKSDYRNDIRDLKQYLVSDRSLGYESTVEGLSLAAATLRDKEWAEQNHARARELFGQLFTGEQTDWDSITKSLEWLIRISSLLNRPRLPIEVSQQLSSSDELPRFASPALQSIMEKLNHASENADRLRGALKSFNLERGGFEESSFSVLLEWLESKSDRQALQDWLGYQRAVENCRKMGLEDFVRVASQNGILAKDLRDTFLQRFFKGWLAEVNRESPTLFDFNAISHEEIIQEFRNLDMKLKEGTIELVRQHIARTQPKAGVATAGESQMANLLREAQKRRRIKPLRRLFAEIPQLLQELKPCLLMSPLSVASYIGTSPYTFDMVIFDEASQIPPADAIGSILRGSQLIVAGDDKQLPPTRFFQADTDLAEEETVEEPLESVLDECLALPSFRRVLLKWHYRSKREELIDFSNKNFYENDLVTFPSPDAHGGPVAVEFRHVPDGVYDRGGSRKNLREAEVVVDLIEEHFRHFGIGSTLGVITLGIAQEEAISDGWERRKALKPDLAALAEGNPDEPFFIKSLEKVQGDERDRIIISLSYGRDRKGILSMYFGPINQTGGERRLNVLVTRAREKITLVSSILPGEIDLARLTTGSRGVELMQKYLEYASQGGRFLTQTYGGGEPESDFEYDVREKLESRGLKVDAQIGCSGFRIDLAIKHPIDNKRYILGVECDGATYHAHRCARDRDRLRQEVLEKLGWKIYRIWSTDWIKNPNRIVEDMMKKISDLKGEGGVPVADVKSTAIESPRNEASYGSASDMSHGGNSNQNQASSTDPNYGFVTYGEFATNIRLPTEELYNVPHYSRYLRKLAEIITEMVKKESPVHIRAVERRIAVIYGIGKVGSKVAEIVENAIKWSVSRKMFQLKEQFLWIGTDVIPRVPSEADSPRPVEEIALEELMIIAETIVKKELGITRESLIRTTARALGYGRTGVNMEERISEAIQQLVENGRLDTYGAQLTIPRPPK